MSDLDALVMPGADGLLGRRALVIGAETTTGTAIARALGEAGADVALAVLRPDEGVLIARRLQRELRDRGRQAMTYAMDVTLGRNVQVTTRQISKELGGLDLVVSAPDEAFLASLAQTSDAQLAQTMTLNGYAHAFAARTAFDEFRRQGEGERVFILVTHALGERAAAGAVAASMAAAAALGLLRSLAREHPGGEHAAAGLLRGASLPDGADASIDRSARGAGRGRRRRGRRARATRLRPRLGSPGIDPRARLLRPRRRGPRSTARGQRERRAVSGSELAGRHALVAGAAEGLGRALATGLAAAGADVSVTTRRDDVAEEVTANSILNECWTYGREGRALRLDLTDLDAVSAAFAQLEQRTRADRCAREPRLRHTAASRPGRRAG